MLKKRFFRLLAAVGMASVLAGCVVAPMPGRGADYYRSESSNNAAYYYEPAARVEYVVPPLWPAYIWFGSSWRSGGHDHHRRGGPPYRNGYRGGGRR